MPRPQQPDECRQGFPLLVVPIGQELTTVWKRYETLITDQVNPRIARCYRFNEDPRAGSQGAP